MGKGDCLTKGYAFLFNRKKDSPYFGYLKSYKVKFFAVSYFDGKNVRIKLVFSEMVVGGGSFLCSVFDIYYGKVEGRSNGFTAHYNLLLCILRF